MTAFGRLHLGLALFLLLVGAGRASLGAEAQRVVSVGGTVTEIVYALGQADRLVARDTTSSWPPEATALPDVGYMRALSAEGVLSVGPDLILLEQGSGPPETLDLLNRASVPLVTVPEAFDADGILRRIRIVAEALGVPERGAALAGEVSEALNRSAAIPVPEGARKRVLFILSAQGGRILASGGGTSADAVIRLAGAENAVTGFSGYKQLTDEAVAAARPDVILMMDREGDHAITDDALVAMPALSQTPAAGHRSILRMDGLLLLGFGPRTPQAVGDLKRAIYGAAP